MPSPVVVPGLRFLARLEARLHAYWTVPSPGRRYYRFTGALLFCFMSICVLGDNGCPCDAIYHGYLAKNTSHPTYTGTNGAQTGTASFQGNFTSIAAPSGSY